jgi:hypothetical protein
MKKIDKMVLRFLEADCRDSICEDCGASDFCEEANAHYSNLGLRVDGKLMIDIKEIEEGGQI